MTVLIAAGSSEGIAIAADGFRRSKTGDYSTKIAQKVWQGITQDGRSVIFGWTGTTHINKFSASFSLSQVSGQILLKMNFGDYDNSPSSFVADFAASISSALEKFLDKSDSRHALISDSGEIAAVAIGWFAGAIPVCAGIAFVLENAAVVANQTFLYANGEDFITMLSGSSTLIEREDRIPSSLEDAIVIAKDFTQACVDNQRAIPDCATFGGHVHVASLTTDGFSWVVPPLK